MKKNEKPEIKIEITPSSPTNSDVKKAEEDKLKRTPKGGYLKKGQNAFFAYYDVETPEKPQKQFTKIG